MKTKIFTLFLTLVASAGIAKAEVITGYCGAESGGTNLTWSLNTEDSVLTISGIGEMAYRNGWSSHPGRNSLKEVILTNGVTNIADYAFSNCGNLISVTIPNTVTSIGSDAFYMCKKLKSVNIPNGVTYIGRYAFAECNMTTITLPNSLLSLPIEGAFMSCWNLTAINVDTDNPSFCSVNGVLFDKDKKTLIQYPAGKKGSYSIPTSVATIGQAAFQGCSGLTSIEIPSSVTNIGSGAFWGCSCLTSVEIPTSVTSIGEYAFCYCSSLISVMIYSNNVINELPVRNIFGTQVREYIIGENVTNIIENAFRDCTDLLSISVEENNPNYCSKDGVLFNKNKTTLVRYPTSKHGKYSVPNNVTSIGSGAFYACSGLTSVEIPTSVTNIGEMAFMGCKGVSAIAIPDDVNSIGEKAFLNVPLITYRGKALGAPWGAKCLNNYNPALAYTLESIISVTDNSIAEWENLPAEYVVESQCPADASLTGLKSVKVYADGNCINILVEPNMADITDLSVVPFHVLLNTDNSDATGGYGNEFLDANTDVILEGFVFIDGDVVSWNPSVFKWWGEVGGSGWEWTDPNVEHSAADCWGALVCEGELTNCASQFVDGKIEIQFLRELIPATWSDDAFGIGFDIQQNWSTVGVLPLVSPIYDNTQGYAKKLTVKIDKPIKRVSIDGIKYILDDEEHSAQVVADYYIGNISIPSSIQYKEQTYNVTRINDKTFMPSTYLPSITIPSSVNYIGDSAVAECITLTSIVCKALIPPALGENVFLNVNKSIPLYVPEESVEIYRTTAQWKEFNILAVDKNGKCGDNMALNWQYDSNKLLTIYGNGTLNSNYTFGLKAPSEVETLIIAEGVTSIGNSAFSGYTTLKYMSIPSSVETIYEQAFYNCTGLQEIYSYRAEPADAYSNTFDGISKSKCTLHVLAESIDIYSRATGWRDFYKVETIDAETVTDPVDEVVVNPTDNTAEITWPAVDNSNTYEITITKNSEVVCTLIFNANGQLIGIAFAPSRNNANEQQTEGFKFTVTGLTSNTTYNYAIIAKDNSNQPLDTKSGTFKTKDKATGIDQITDDQLPITNKIIRDDKIFILRGDKVYTVDGRLTN